MLQIVYSYMSLMCSFDVKISLRGALSCWKQPLQELNFSKEGMHVVLKEAVTLMP